MSEAKLYQEETVPEYHQSGLGMYLKCQLQFYFRYLQGIVIPPSAALTLGKSVDEGVTHNLIQKTESRQDLPLGDVLDAYSSKFDAETPGTDWKGEGAGKTKDVGIALIKLHHTKVAPNIQPVTVQEEFNIETDEGYSIGGTFDLTDENGFIRDTKTSKTKYSDDAVETSIQAAVYDFAHEVKKGQKAKGFVFDVLKKTKVPDYQEVVGQVSRHQQDMVLGAFTDMHKNIQTGRFMPAPEGAWWSSKSWCGYWSQCKGKKS